MNDEYYKLPYYMRSSDCYKAPIELDESKGEVICPVCDGEGTVLYKQYNQSSRCPKCQGKKKLDWVEQSTGVTPPKENLTFCTSCSSRWMIATCNSMVYITCS